MGVNRGCLTGIVTTQRQARATESGLSLEVSVMFTPYPLFSLSDQSI